MKWFSRKGLANIRAAVAASNRRRGEQDPVIRAAKKRYTQHKANAKQRQILWQISFDEWLRVWLASGKFMQSGRRSGQYCMSRYGDKGAYEVGNVFINLSSVNFRDGVIGRKRTPAQNKARARWMRGNKNSLGRKWLFKDGICVCASKTKVDGLLAEGWTFGRR